MELEIKNYASIINDILQFICSGIENDIDFEYVVMDNSRHSMELPNSTILSQNTKMKWEKTSVLHDKKITTVCYVNNENTFMTHMGASLYDPIDNSFPVFNYFITRLLNNIMQIILDDITDYKITTYFPNDKEIILIQSVIDFLINCELPDVNFFTYISSLNYENRPCHGKILFISDDDFLLGNCLLSFENSIEFTSKNQRMIRKLLETSKEDSALLFNTFTKEISGMISAKDNSYFENRYLLEFCGHMHWILKYNSMIAIEYINGRYYITDDFKRKENFETQLYDYFKRYPKCQFQIEQAKILINIAKRQAHGTIVIISDHAQQEAERLSSKQRGIQVKPFNILNNKTLIQSITTIDGALLLDQNFQCYAFGVILDGPATNGDQSRGARYNSALTYKKWKSSKGHHICAIVISEDKIVNVV